MPLLERVKFLAIFSANLDEFYMVRVAGLRRQVAAGVVQTPPDGLTPQEQLDAIDAEVARVAAMQRQCLATLLDEARARMTSACSACATSPPRNGARSTSTSSRRSSRCSTPLAVDPGHPFPYISNLSLSLAVEIRDPDNGGDALRAREGAEEPAALDPGARRGPTSSCRSSR